LGWGDYLVTRITLQFCKAFIPEHPRHVFAYLHFVARTANRLIRQRRPELMSVQNQVLHRLAHFLDIVLGHQLIKLLPGAEPDPVPQFLLVVLDPLLCGLR
jgi:hypothetical protein